MIYPICLCRVVGLVWRKTDGVETIGTGCLVFNEVQHSLDQISRVAFAVYYQGFAQYFFKRTFKTLDEEVVMTGDVPYFHNDFYRRRIWLQLLEFVQQLSSRIDIIEVLILLLV